MPDTMRLPDYVARDAQGCKCACGGYCDRALVTAEEDAQLGCGRTGCCSRAFVCSICGTRWIGKADAPEMEVAG